MAMVAANGRSLFHHTYN